MISEPNLVEFFRFLQPGWEKASESYLTRLGVERLVAIFPKDSSLMRRQSAGGGCHPDAEDTVALTML